ncbi:MAG: NAD(P)H-dependent oxidoreductase [Eubacteriaceae bacterium]
MHKILVINGSPKKRSNTMKLVDSFLEGIKNKEPLLDISKVHLIEKEILPCTGCYSCWKKTEGSCILEDDMEPLFQEYLQAEIIIWATPLYHFGITSTMKKFMERTLPELLPFIDSKGYGVYQHPHRYPELTENKKHILISNCGFPSEKNNYEGVFKQFDNLFGEGKWEKIICTEGELLNVHQLDNFTIPYLETVKIAGEEYGETHHISEKTKIKLEKPFVEVDAFLKMSNLSWGIQDPRNAKKEDPKGALNFMKQMAGVFNPRVSKNLRAVLEMNFTDIKEKYQFEVKDNQCILITEDFLDPTTRINTDMKTWERITEGKIDPSQALIDRKYSVEGDFKIMNAMFDGLFGSMVFHQEKRRFKPISFVNTPYWFILTMIPWCICFIMTNFSSILGVVTPLIAIGILCAIKKGSELNLFDKGTLIFFSMLTLLVVPWGTYYSGMTISIMALFGLALIFGISLIKIMPLTGDYTHYLYGKNALKNRLFINTNRWLTGFWTLVFVLQGLLALLLGSFDIIYFQSILPILVFGLGIFFTVWFARWYPAHYARPEEIDPRNAIPKEGIDNTEKEEVHFEDITPELLKPKRVAKESEISEFLKTDFKGKEEDRVKTEEDSLEVTPEDVIEEETIAEIDENTISEEDTEKDQEEMVVFKVD